MKILGPPLISFIIIIIFLLLLIQYWILIKNKSLLKYKFIFFLRTLLISFVIILILNPWILVTSNIKKNQNIAVIYDMSKSMQKHYV